MALIDIYGRKKGNQTERAFKKWLEKNKIPYLYIQQDQETFSGVFQNTSGKRPDFMILIPNLGFIMVDVKYKTLNTKYRDFAIDALEAKKYSNLQRKFNLPIWFAISNQILNYKSWFWIPVSKVLEQNISKFKSSKSKMDYFAVPLNNFIKINENESLNKLFLDNSFEDY